MPENQATYDAYLGIDIELPDGRVIHVQALTFKRALYYTRLLDQAQQTGAKAFYRFLDEFSAEIKTTDGQALAKLELTVPEMFEVGRRFLWRNRLARNPAGPTTATEPSAGTT